MGHPPAPSLSVSESCCIDPVLPDGVVLSEDNTVVKEACQVATRAVPQAFSFLCGACGFSNVSSIWAARRVSWAGRLLTCASFWRVPQLRDACPGKRVSDQEIVMIVFLKDHSDPRIYERLIYERSIYERSQVPEPGT